MLSDDLKGKKVVAKRHEFWHVGFISYEKHCSEVFFRWVACCKKTHRLEKLCFFAYVISGK